jgi:hypothetical protein
MRRSALWVIGLAAWLACRAHDQPVTPGAPAAHPLTNAVPSPSTQQMVAAAEQALAVSVPLDYRRPLLAASLDRTPVRKLFFDACRAGDRRSCWMVDQIADPAHHHLQGYEVAAAELVRAHCRTGDLMSCRAMPGSTEAVHDELPGWTNRWLPCSHDGCDTAPLKNDCQAGFPNSCVWLSYQDRGVADSIAASEATVRLTHAGCAAGIVEECEMLYGVNGGDSLELLSMSPDPPQLAERRFGAERACALSLVLCNELGVSLLRSDADRDAARDVLERACQYTANPTRQKKYCEMLWFAYTGDGHARLLEPVPGRAIALKAWLDR